MEEVLPALSSPGTSDLRDNSGMFFADAAEYWRGMRDQGQGSVVNEMETRMLWSSTHHGIV